jgi:hypothetical protein
MGALIGCPIYVSAYGCVARPTGEDLDTILQRFSVEEALASPWHAVMNRLLDRAKELAGDSHPVEQLHLRGVVDMLAASLGETSLCTLLLDQPRQIRALAGRYTDLLLAVARQGIELRGPWRGGYLCRWGVYAPGPLHDYQADASTILSPQLYEDVLMDFDREVLAAFPYTLIHLHAAGLHMVDPLLRIRELGAVQINLDRETGVWNKGRVLALSRRIQNAGKGLIICGDLSEEDFQEFAGTLEAEGLILDCRILPDLGTP